MELQRKMELIATRVTLDGKPAVIVGAKERFARVAQLDFPHTNHEWAWETVDMIVRERNGAFNS